MTNNNLIKKMIRFLKENGLKDNEIIEVKQDLKEMALEAEQSEISLEEFLGKDYKDFCIELLEVGYDFKSNQIHKNVPVELIGINKEIMLILLPSLIMTVLSIIDKGYVVPLFIALEIIVSLSITAIIITRDKVKFSKFNKELLFTNIIGFLILLFFSLPRLNLLGDGIFGNYYIGIYESLLIQWVRVIEYSTINPAIVILNENIIMVNDYIFSFSITLLIGYAFYTYMFKKTQVKYLMVPLATLAIILSILEYFTNFQVPFTGVIVFGFMLVLYILQFDQLKFKKKRQILYSMAGFFLLVLLLSLFIDIEFIDSNELYYGQDLFYVIKLILLTYLVGILVYGVIGLKKVSRIQNFYTFLNVFMIAYAMFMISSYLYLGIDQFNIEDPLNTWQSIRIVNQMAFGAYGYYVIDTLIRKYSILDNSDN